MKGWNKQHNPANYLKFYLLRKQVQFSAKPHWVPEELSIVVQPEHRLFWKKFESPYLWAR